MRVACLILMMTLISISSAAAQTTEKNNYIPICLVHLIKDINIPARESGLLKELSVKENDPVQFEQVIGQIDDQVAKRMREQAQLKHAIAMRQFEDKNQIEMAERKMVLTAEEYKVNFRLFQKGSKTKFEATRSLYQQQISRIEHAAAIEAQQLAGMQAQAEQVNVKAAEDSLDRHVIKSPIEGYVLQKFKDAGEWVNAGEDVVRVAPLNRLEVHGNMESNFYNPEEIDGKPVTVTLIRARGERIEFEGQVVRVGLENMGGTKFKVVAEVVNRKDATGNYFMLKSQSQVSMTIHVDRQVRRVAKEAIE